MFPQCRWAPTSKFRGTTTLCSICKKKTLVDRTLPSLSLLAGKERTSWMLAPGQSGHAGAPGHSPAGGSCWKWWRWIHTWGACSCPADGAGSSQRRSESRKQWLKRCTEEGSGSDPPRRRWQDGLSVPGPAPGLPAQRHDCLPAPDVPLRAAAQRSFSALLNDGSVPFQVGKVPLPRPFPDPRQPGTCRTRVAFPDSAGNVKKESDAVIPRAL